jgi:hypothetical protein
VFVLKQEVDMYDTHPVKNPEPADFEPDGSWYGMIAFGGNLYAIEPNHGELDSIAPQGIVTRLVDISETQGHTLYPPCSRGRTTHFM